MKHFRLKKVLALAMLLFVGLPALAQVKVTGQIVDEQSEPLIAVSVLEKGTTNGTVTDFDGNFELTVKTGAILEVSYVGYVTQQVKVEKGKVLKIVMKEDSQALEELVVVGYGVQKKSSVTGAVSQVKAEDMEARTITRPEQALQGKTAGVQILSGSAAPGSSPSVRIRGVSSNGDSSPLYVVDGRIASDIGGIDPNDIESMEVLKDGASAAIYGAAAGNGVILITTKKGKGAGKITYDFQLTSQSLGKIPHMMNSEQYIDYWDGTGTLDINNVYRYWDTKTNTSWLDEGFETSMMKRHNVTFQAGSDQGSLYVSLGYVDNNGMVKGDKDVYERLTGMVNASWKLKPWLEITTNNQIETYNMKTVSSGSEYGSMILGALQMDPLTPAYYTEENLPDFMVDVKNNLGRYGHLLKNEAGLYYGLSPFQNNGNTVHPLFQRDASDTKNSGHNLNGSTSINFTPIKGLVITSRLGYRLGSGESRGVNYRSYGSFQQNTRYMTVSASDSNSKYWQWENFLNYSRSFGKHNASVMLGTSFSESRSHSVSGSVHGGVDADDVVDLGFKQENPLFYYFAYRTGAAVQSVSGGEPNYSRRYSYFGRANWDYEGKYMAQFSLRADAADLSVLPKPKRWGYFPAASLGWVISNENFMENTHDWLSHLKFRVSWGQNGSTASLGGYRYASEITSQGNVATGNGLEYKPAYQPSATGNYDLKWETSEQTNIGIDARFLNNRLSFTADYFKKETKDLIVDGIVPSTVVGNKVSPVNAGNVTNSGFEFELGWQDRIKDFSYSVRGNLATLKNEVTYVPESLGYIPGAGYFNYGTITRFEVGHPAWYFYGYNYLGVDPASGNPVFEDVNGDGLYSEADKMSIGKGLADFTYGLTFSASYKNFDMIVFGTGSVGNDIFCGIADSNNLPINKPTYFTENSWTPTNTNAKFPRPKAAYETQLATSSAYIFDGSYFKIKQIQLGYTLPKKIAKKVALDNLRVYGSLEDFFTFASYPGFDPEVTGTGSSLGIDRGTYPNSKKVVLGLSLTF